MLCVECGAGNRAGRKFCLDCGAALAIACPSCGAANEPDARFCGDCGTQLEAAPAPTPPVAELPRPEAPEHERRLVSVLFADLVGFTAISEGRDPEEVRDLLTGYFDTARRIIERYGGVVEKFIGDAVMAVWGTPVATEDDAERAVRAALELTLAVTALGEAAGLSGLEARAGIVTGSAAVNLAAHGQGMVAGDVVNTASRVQAVAEPRSVMVDDATRRVTHAAITYDDAGAYELKGKAAPVSLWRAGQVVAGRLGALRAAGLEAPFVGREREMRLVKELFHATADETRAQLVSAIGIGGIGKSRIAWEFFKYIDGLNDVILWHRGRCLSYGDGVTYWALAEMIKMRARIVEEEEPESAAAKLREVIEHHVADPEERRWLEPRLAHLLGLEQRAKFEREDLFAGWRLFFERIADGGPTVLVFEDIQWADASLLDFIEYLLEWSRNHSLFVLTLGRPELAERRPGWGAGKRSFTSLFLEPLRSEAMDELLCGLVPGLSEDVRGRIRARAEGIPLYAVETVRMLLDRGLLRRDGDGYVATGPLETLEVPESLHALIAARLDGLPPEERRLLQDAAVLGKSFTKQGLDALGAHSGPGRDGSLASLVRKDLLTQQADPMSPERGQYSFLQALVQKVSYDTLSRKERRARHLAVADYLETSSGYDIDEIVEVVSYHYIEAYEAAPDATDAAEVKAKAGAALAGAGERAASLGATEEAQRYFEQAAALADGPVTRAELLEGAGRMARTGGRPDAATAHFECAISLFDGEGLTHRSARASARLAEVVWLNQGRTDEAIQRLTQSLELLSEDEPDGDIATLAETLATMLFFTGQVNAAGERIELALEIAESLWLPEGLAQALITKSFVLDAKGRRAESLGLLKYALEIALESDIPSVAVRAYGNLGYQMQTRDRCEEALGYIKSALALARRLGDRPREWFSATNSIFPLFVVGDWDEAVAQALEIPDPAALEKNALASLMLLSLIHVNRGDLDAARHILALGDSVESTAVPEYRALHACGRAIVQRAEGSDAQAVPSGKQAMEVRSTEGLGHESVKQSFVEAVEAAFGLDDRAEVEELLAVVEDSRPVEVPQYLHAHVARFRARLAALAGKGDEVERGFKSAAGMFREIGVPFYLAVTLLEHAEWLIEQARTGEADPMMHEARETFDRLGAKPWLERLDRSAGHSSSVITRTDAQSAVAKARRL